MDYFANTIFLSTKSLKVISRNRGYFLSFILSPFVVIIFMFFYQKTYENHIKHHEVIDFPEEPIGGISKCREPVGCVSLGIFAVGEYEDWIGELKNRLAFKNSLKPDEDVKYIGQGSPADLQNYIDQNPNKTQIFAVFCTSKWEISLRPDPNNQSTKLNISIPCTFDRIKSKKLVFYTLVMNASLGYSAVVFRSLLVPSPYNSLAINTKKEVDEVIMDYFGRSQSPASPLDSEQGKTFRYEASYQGYPVSTQRIFKNFDFFSMRGSFFFYMPIAISFLIVVTEMNYEKDKGIKMYLVGAGMKSGAYWTSWHVVNLCLSSFIALSITLTCRLFNVKLFTLIPFELMFLVFFASAFGMNSIGYLINSLCASKELRQAASYGFLLISFFFQIFFSAPNSCNIFYSENFLSAYIKILKIVLVRYPGFNYTKIFADYVHVSGSFFDTATFKFSEGKKYTYGDFFQNFQGNLPNGIFFNVPSAFDSFKDLTINIIAFSLIAWYSDNVLATNQGVPKSFLFCLKKKEYYKAKRIQTSDSPSSTSTRANISLEDASFTRSRAQSSGSLDGADLDSIIGEGANHRTVEFETSVVSDLMNTDKVFDGIICSEVVKAYRTGTNMLCWRSKPVLALKGISISAQKGDLVAILGQNGAGKTTLVNILSGYMKQTKGTAKLFGLDVRSQLEEIREIVSLCPQFDIFWDDLTVYEHLELVYLIKGLDKEDKERYLHEAIREINLEDKKNTRISELSGGMRRRVSIGMSKIGDPKILFLDEPTTGLDPINQKEIVKLLENIKKDRVIILVTHLMEEAEILSDKVIIMHKGEVIRVGNPMELKTELKYPFKINVTYGKGLEAELKSILSRHITDLKMIHRGNYATILADHGVIREFLTLIKEKTQKKDSLNDIVVNWDIATASLEELFLELTKK